VGRITAARGAAYAKVITVEPELVVRASTARAAEA
jgi:hypothetical protein